MKVLVIGSGAREHAIVWKLCQSPKLTEIYCAPGNAGIGEMAKCVNISSEDLDGLLKFSLQNKIDLTVVGPEVPLVKGIVDLFEQNGLRIFGPCKAAAQLEGSKVYAKELMQKHKIPTARYKVYNDFEKAVSELSLFQMPVVVKADGLAAGKGVIIAQSRQKAVEAIYDMMRSKKFGVAGEQIVIEEFLSGKEVSLLAFIDENSIIPMVSAQDYKRALDGDAGLNTGGMGAVSPAFHYSIEAEKVIKSEIVERTWEALKAEGICYKGVLYFGLMLTAEGPKVLEFNVRFGDPETEAILLRLQSDLLEIMELTVENKLYLSEIKWFKEHAVCVVMASGGYPADYQKGYKITGIHSAEAYARVFHGGTMLRDGQLETAGGRVLVLSALGEDCILARSKVYEGIGRIFFDNQQFRSDIAKK